MKKQSKIEIIAAIILIAVGLYASYYYLFIDPATLSGETTAINGFKTFIPITLGLILILRIALRESENISLTNPYEAFQK